MPFRQLVARYRNPLFAAAAVAAAGGTAAYAAPRRAPEQPCLPYRLARADAPHAPGAGTAPPPPSAEAKQPKPPQPAPRLPAAPPLSRYAVADAVERVLPAVVNIRRVSAPGASGLFGASAPVVQETCGSGVIVSADGLILTNAHVVQQARHAGMQPLGQFNAAGAAAAPRAGDDDAYLEVTLSSGETYVARVVAVDQASDIALVRINGERAFPVAELGCSAGVRPGEFVAAVGSPLALANSVSFGVVSTHARDLSLAATGLNHLQLDVAINEGSSGGPVVSLDGHVVGICSMKAGGDSEGIAFAIPIDYARRAVDDLLAHGFVRRPYVGITLSAVTPELLDDIRQEDGYRPPRWLDAEIRRTNCTKSVGLLVHALVPGAPGARAGLKTGDVIVAVNGAAVTTTSEFSAVLAAHVETECLLRVRRGASGEAADVTLRPEALPANEVLP